MTLASLPIQNLFENFFPLDTPKGSGLKGNGLFPDILKNLAGATGDGKAAPGKGFDLHSLAGLKGRKLLAGLEKLCIDNGMPLEHMVADPAALAALQRLLIRGGFDSDQLKALFGEIETPAGKDGIRVSDLFARLAQIQETEAVKARLDPSAVAYIESILAHLMPDAQKRQMVLDGITGPGDGIDLQKLVENLRRVVDGMPDKGRTAADPSTHRQVQKLMTGMGMAPEKGAVTLDKFVAALSAMAERQTPPPVGRNDLTADASQFLTNLRDVKKDQENGRKPAPVDPKAQGAPDQPKTRLTPPISPDAKATVPGDTAPAKTQERGAQAKGIPATSTDSTRAPALEDRPAVSEPKPAVRTLPAYVVNQVGRQMIRSHLNGIREIKLQLHPPNLGRLQMNLDTRPEGLRVQIVAEQQSAHDLLSSHVNDLKSLLQEQGLRLEKIDFEFTQQFDQSLAHARQDPRESSGRRHRDAAGASPDGTGSGDGPGEAEKTAPPQGILDLVA